MEQCLNSLYRSQTEYDYEVYVVDNASSDGSLQMLQQDFPQVHLIANKDNLGFAKANNQAIKISKSDYVLLLNPDTILQEDTLQKCITKMESDETIGALGIKMFDGGGHFLPESKRGFPTPMAAFSKLFGLSKIFPKSKTFGRYHLGYLDKNQNHEVDVLSGAFMLIRRSVLNKIGYLDEAYFMYGEDIDLSYRIQQAGYKNLYFSESSIIHFKGESTKKGNLNYIKLFYGAMLIFVSKQLSQTQAKLLNPIFKLGIFSKAVLSILEQLLKKIFYPFVDTAIIFSTLLVLKTVFEKYIKQDENLIYPDTFLYINIPIYVGIWLFSLWLLGVYSSYTKWKSILTGIFLGFIGISVVYSFFPLSLRSSRSIIVLAFLINSFTLLAYRFILSKITNTSSNLFYTTNKYLIVCLSEELEDIKKSIEQNQSNSEYIGFVSNNNQNHKEFLGKIEQLQDILAVYPIHQIIFSIESTPMQSMINCMQKIKQPIQFRMISKQQTIISSNDKNSNGEVVSLNVITPNGNSWLQKIRTKFA